MWTGFWSEIRAANTIIDAIGTATALSSQQQAAVTGMAKTFKALAYYRLPTLPSKETAADIFQTTLPIPAAETNARGGIVPTPTCN